ncbi:hypothetical protein AB0O07_17365 [Streptomyces sp. NPDC093085]|uniref:hypothetical protein n=1 Tax=Streptomyces sp. NPDC093085 TaxID=3155068 RepID=UPI003437DC61
MDALTVANDVTPYVTAAIAAYGTAVVTRTTDTVADASVSLGRRIVQRLWQRGEDGTDRTDSTDGAGDGDAGRAGLRRVIDDLAEAPDDADFQAVLRVHLRRVLRADPELAAELAALLPAGGTSFTASGAGSVAVQHNTGIVSTGDGATIGIPATDR